MEGGPTTEPNQESGPKTRKRKRNPPGCDSDVGKGRGQFLRLRRLCSDNDGFHVRSREIITFFSQRGYPRSCLDKDLRRVATIRRPDALRSSEQNDTTSDGVPLVLTYHYQQTYNIFPHPPFVAYKRDISLHKFLVHLADNSSTELSGPRACERPRCHTCNYISPHTELPSTSFIFVTNSPAEPIILCTAYLTSVIPFFTLVKQDEASGVGSVST